MIVDNWVPSKLLDRLKKDARNLQRKGLFTPDALAAYGNKKDGKAFSVARDRTVLPCYYPSAGIKGGFINGELGDAEARGELHEMVEELRLEASRELGRENLGRDKVSWSDLVEGEGGEPVDEISYTRFGPGAYLQRHNDERHEELKRKAGWLRPTRRSLSWLVYLQDEAWDMGLDGGGLRTYQRIAQGRGSEMLASNDGDLQLGWLEATVDDPIDRAVFMDSRIGDVSGNCALYTISSEVGQKVGQKVYLTKAFAADPVLFLTTDFFVNALNFKSLQLRFRFLSSPQTTLGGKLLGEDVSKPPHRGEVIKDVSPLGGRLVVFDSVVLPHEVLKAERERFAVSGWWHVRQQEIRRPMHENVNTFEYK